MSGVFAGLLRGASYKGVTFHLADTSRPGGRRLAVHEIPLRNEPYVEDLGRLPQRLSLRCYFVGDFAAIERDAFVLVLEQAGIGVLVHPTLGRFSAYAGAITASESGDVGAYCSVQVEFIRAGGLASPLSITDTISSLLAGVASLQALVINSFLGQVAALVLGSVGAGVIDFVFGLVGSAFGALPQASQAGVVTGFASVAGQPAGQAGALFTAIGQVAANVVALQPQPTVDDPVAGVVPLYVPVADPSGGLAAMAAFGAALAPQAMVDGQAQAAQIAVVTLVQSAAVAGVLTIYAQTDFVSAQAAEAALVQLLALVEILVVAADLAEDDDAYRAWRAIGALASNYIIAEAQGLPVVAAYAVASARPALVLAQLLYQDATQADALAAFNAAVHPLFMPASGQWLEAA